MRFSKGIVRQHNLLSEEREKKPTESILVEWSPDLQVILCHILLMVLEQGVGLESCSTLRVGNLLIERGL